MPQQLVFEFINMIEPFAGPVGAIPLEIQVLSVLNFLAGGSYQVYILHQISSLYISAEIFIRFFSLVYMHRRVGGDAFSALSQSSVSRFIDKYTRIVSNSLAHRYIKFPQTPNELDEVKRGFQHKFNVHGIIGVIDGTHVKLSALPKETEHAFIDRKGDHSITVQLVCDSNMLIRNVNARFPGCICVC